MAEVTALVYRLSNLVPSDWCDVPDTALSVLTAVHAHTSHQLRQSDVQCVPCHCQRLRHTSHVHCTSSQQRHCELGCGVCVWIRKQSCDHTSGLGHIHCDMRGVQLGQHHLGSITSSSCTHHAACRVRPTLLPPHCNTGVSVWSHRHMPLRHNIDDDTYSRLGSPPYSVQLLPPSTTLPSAGICDRDVRPHTVPPVPPPICR